MNNTQDSHRPSFLRQLAAGALALVCMTPPGLAAASELPPATVEGGLDMSTVRDVVRENISDVRHCYNAALSADETVTGTTLFDFVVESDGSVGRVEVSESTMPERFDACLVAAVGAWSFPSADAQTSVTYPLQMSPG